MDIQAGHRHLWQPPGGRAIITIDTSNALELCSSNVLRVLSPGDVELIIRSAEVVELSRGDVLIEPGDIVRYTYLPCGPTLLSFMVLLEDAKGVETALIGREGAAGGIVSQGQLPAFSRCVVQYPGTALRIDGAALEAAKSESLSIRHFFARYADCLLGQVFQSTACNAAHSIEQRTAKWLIAAIERTGTSVLPLTQQQLSGMLGVGRSYVSRVIGSLKRRGVIVQKRGVLMVADRDALERLSCRCNEEVKRHFEIVLAGVYPGDEGGSSLVNASGLRLAATGD